MLLINDYSFKCIGDMPSSYILALPFNLEVEDNYLNILWPYLKGLLEAPNIIRYGNPTHMGRCDSQKRAHIGKKCLDLHGQ
jgi:hypothetical protein